MTSEILAAFEKRLDPAHPEGGPFGCQVIGYGEVSAVLNLDALADRVLKRISGFANREHADRYAERVRHYIETLTDRGVSVAPTEVQVVSGQRPAVYLLQPRFPPHALGHVGLRTTTHEELRHRIEQVLNCVANLLRTNRSRADRYEVAVDSQLSNWAFCDAAPPQLMDVGSPIFRVGGRLDVMPEVIYRAFPQPVRWWVRRSQSVERYFADYFDLRLAILDLLGNFIKEGAAERVPEGVALVKDWLGRQPEATEVVAIDVGEVRRYYRQDAAKLELSLRVRRVTRFVTTKILRRRYDFILPGKVER